MTPALLLAFVFAYFAGLLAVAWCTGRGAGDAGFYAGQRRSPWPLVAFGMIGTSLSGVTFVSVPGSVGSGGFGYLQIVIGHVLGYAVVAWVLLPLYFRLGVTSIYDTLGQRIGGSARRTGAAFFVVSRTLGATARLYLVVRILQDLILDAMGVPFWLTTLVIVLMILLYTLEGGVKTIVWTDTLQTAGMLAGLAICTALLLQRLDLSPAESFARLQEAGLARLWGADPKAADFWLKQLVAGAFIAIAMTGMDQEMMQKSLSVATRRGAQKNMLVLSVTLLAVVAAFLWLGGLLHLAAADAGLAARGDRLFPAVVTELLPAWVQVVFVLALVSALFPSADGALTALTASTCLDLLRLPERAGLDDATRRAIRRGVHGAFALLFVGLVLGFRALDDPSMIGVILKVAAYTYGPLLGLFAFAVFLAPRRAVRGAAVPAVALAAPVLCALLDANQAAWLPGGWRIGLEMLVINGTLTFAGLWAASRPQPPTIRSVIGE